MAPTSNLNAFSGLTLATSELWCIAPGHAMAAGRLPEIAAQPRHQARTSYAVVELLGTLTKSQTVPLRERIRALAADPNVGQIILLVDSPGGTVAGTHDLFLAISAAAKIKPVIAVVEDMCCSGGLYAVAGASQIVVGETALVGSIGVFAVKIDESKLLERIGVEVVIIRSGEHKGAGVQGTRMTPEQLGELKRVVDVQAKHFQAAIAKGRRMNAKRVADLADGRVFVGREAVAVGLADRIGTFEEVLDQAHQETIGLMYADLRGIEALDQFDELVAGEVARSNCSEGVARERIRGRYTTLAKAALAEEDRRAADQIERYQNYGKLKVRTV